jgi:hypothetical protein
MIAAQLGDRPAAIQALDTALTINPHFSPVHAPEARRALHDLRLVATTAGEIAN